MMPATEMCRLASGSGRRPSAVRTSGGGRLVKPLLVLSMLALAGCSTVMPPRARIDTPMVDHNRLASMRAVPQREANGSIFQAGATRNMFEDRRARQPGDMLTILIEERLVAKHSSNSTIDRKGGGSAKFGALPFVKAGKLMPRPATASRARARPATRTSLPAPSR